MSVWIFDQKLFIAASRSETGELRVVATNAKPTVAIAIYLIGEWRAINKKPILFKKHNLAYRMQNNLFRYGFDFIRKLLLNPFANLSEFKDSLKQLIPKLQQIIK